MAVAFLAMGGWAAFVNRGHGAGAAFLAFLVQGALSGAITLGLKRWLEAAHARLDGPWARLAPPIVSCALILALLRLAHGLAGTPEPWRTLALPWTVSTVYAFVYTWSLPRRAPA